MKLPEARDSLPPLGLRLSEGLCVWIRSVEMYE